MTTIPVPDPARPGWVHGSALTDGKINYFSVSAIQTADSTTENGCPRRYWYRYGEGFKEEASAATILGTEGHEQVEHYLRTGDRGKMSSRALAGMGMLPDPGPDLMIEHSVVPTNPDTGVEDLSLAPLRAAGIPFVGRIDCMHARGTNRGGVDIEDTLDPPGTIEVIDWKFVGKLDWAKRAEELPKTVQMAGYAKYVWNVYPQTPNVRLSHGYFPKTGNPRKVSLRVVREQVDETWNRVEGLASYLRDAAKTREADNFEANTRACMSFGRPCPASKVCSAFGTNTLAARLSRKPAAPLGSAPTTMTTPAEPTMAQKLGVASQAAPSAADIAAEKQRLQTQALVAKILAAGLGFPTFSGPAALTLAALVGTAAVEFQGQPLLSGTGELAGYKFDKIEVLPQILAEVEGEIAKRAAKAAAESQPTQTSVLPPDAPQPSKPKVPAPVDAATTTITQQAAEPAPKKRGRPPKAAEKTATVEAPIEDTSPPSETGFDAVTQALTTPSTAINLFIDCAFEGEQPRSLWDIVDPILREMRAASPGGDFRSVPNDHQFGYNKWRGYYANALRVTPIPPGDWKMESMGGAEIASMTIETMREVVRTSGGRIIRGVRS